MEITKENYKRIKEDLADMEEYVKDFSDFLPLAVCTVNPLGMITDFNRTAEMLTGYEAIEVMGSQFSSLFLEKEKIAELEKKIKTKNNLTQELTLVSKHKEKIPVNVPISKRTDKKGSYIGYFAALFDITESKAFKEEMEKKVKIRTKELQERIDELERFHDLTVGREIKMLELKKEIKKLKANDQKRR